MQKEHFKEAYSGKEAISFRKTAESFSKAIESGKDIFHIDADRNILKKKLI